MGLRDRLKRRVKNLVGSESKPTPRPAPKGEPFPSETDADGWHATVWDKELGFENPVYRSHPDGTPLVLVQRREAVVAFEWDPKTQGRLRYVDGRLMSPEGSWDAFSGEGEGTPLIPRVCRSRERVVWVGPRPGGDALFDAIEVLDGPSLRRTGPASPPVRTIWRDLTEGEGEPCVVGDAVMVHYVGLAWSTGEVFHNTWEKRSPYPSKLVDGALIPGFYKGLVGLRQGQRRLLVMPPWDGFGEDGSEDVVLPGETLVFLVERGKPV